MTTLEAYTELVIREAQHEMDPERQYQEALREAWSLAARAASAAARKGRGKGKNASKMAGRSAYKKAGGSTGDLNSAMNRGARRAQTFGSEDRRDSAGSGILHRYAAAKATQTLARQKARFGKKISKRDQRQVRHLAHQYV